MIKEEFLQPLPLRLGSPQQVFMDVEFINQQGVLNAMHHHTDLQQNETQKLQRSQHQYLTLTEKTSVPFTYSNNGIDTDMEKTMTATSHKSAYNEFTAVAKKFMKV